MPRIGSVAASPRRLRRVTTRHRATDDTAAADPLATAIASRLPGRPAADRRRSTARRYRDDETAYLHAGLPARRRASRRRRPQVAELVRIAGELRVPIVPRGAGTGLSGGAAGIEGGLTIAFTAMDRILEIDRENLVAVVQPGIINADLKAAVAAEGLFYAARPGQLRDVLDRRQPRHERGRPVLRQVRPDARLGPVARGRHGRRRGDPDRRPERQGRRRLLADPPVRRQPGHARDHHRGDAPAPSRAAAALDDARLLPDARRAPATRSPGSPRPGCRRSRSSCSTGSRSPRSTT